MKLTKDTLARMCASASMREELRQSYKGYDIFIADGFASRPEVTLQKFGVEPGQFPFGVFCTLWAVAKGEDFVEIASVITSNNGNDSLDRITKALDQATTFISRRAAIARQGMH